MQLHVDAEFRNDYAGDLVSTNEPAATIAPRFFLGHTTLGLIVRFRNDVPADRRRSLEKALTVAERAPSMSALGQPLDAMPFERILSHDSPIQHTSVGLAFRFPRSLPPALGTRVLRDAEDAALLHPLLAAWAGDIRASPPLVAVLIDGHAVAVCGSVRITPRAHEAGLETAAPFRGRGYGRAAVSAWATAVRAVAAEPLYSTTWQNDASRAVAHTLGLIPVGRDLHIR